MGDSCYELGSISLNLISFASGDEKINHCDYELAALYARYSSCFCFLYLQVNS